MGVAQSALQGTQYCTGVVYLPSELVLKKGCRDNDAPSETYTNSAPDQRRWRAQAGILPQVYDTPAATLEPAILELTLVNRYILCIWTLVKEYLLSLANSNT